MPFGFLEDVVEGAYEAVVEPVIDAGKNVGVHKPFEEVFDEVVDPWRRVGQGVDKMGENLGAQAEAKYTKEQKKKMELDNLRGEFEKTLEKSRAKEDQFRGALSRQTGASTEAVDRLLSSLIDQTGYVTGLTKQVVGSQMADRGILRSGQTAKRLEGVDEAKAREVGTLVGQRNEQIRKIKDTQRQALQKVEDRRFEIEHKFKEARLMGYQDIAYKEKLMQLDMEAKRYINELELNAQSTQALFDALGGLAQLGGMYYGMQGKGTTDYLGNAANYGYGPQGTYTNNPGDVQVNYGKLFGGQ